MCKAMTTSTLKIKPPFRFFDTTQADLLWLYRFIFQILIWRQWLQNKTRNHLKEQILGLRFNPRASKPANSSSAELPFSMLSVSPSPLAALQLELCQPTQGQASLQKLLVLRIAGSEDGKMGIGTPARRAWSLRAASSSGSRLGSKFWDWRVGMTKWYSGCRQHRRPGLWAQGECFGCVHREPFPHMLTLKQERSLLPPPSLLFQLLPRETVAHNTGSCVLHPVSGVLTWSCLMNFSGRYNHPSLFH